MLKRAQGWQIQYGHRDTNCATHRLAKLACTLDCDRIYIEDYPPSITNLVKNDILCTELQV